MKSKIISLFLLSVWAIDMSAQQPKTILNRAEDQDLKLQVNDGGVAKDAVVINGATGNVNLDGKLGIREASPSYQIDVLSPTGDGNMLRLSREGGTNATMNLGTFFTMFYEGSAFLQADSSSNVNILNGNLTVSDDVGIGTTSPETTLDVRGSIMSRKDVTNGTAIAPAQGRRAYLVIVGGNFSSGSSVRSGIYHVILTNEGTGVAFTNEISDLNACTATFSVSGGNLIISGLPSGNFRAAVYHF